MDELMPCQIRWEPYRCVEADSDYISRGCICWLVKPTWIATSNSEKRRTSIHSEILTKNRENSSQDFSKHPTTSFFYVNLKILLYS